MYQDLELEKDALEVSVTIMEVEKKDLEDKILKLEAHKYEANRQMGELRTHVEEMEVHNRSLETQLKTTNGRKPDITPFRDQACLIWRKIHQVQLSLTKDIYKVK